MRRQGTEKGRNGSAGRRHRPSRHAAPESERRIKILYLFTTFPKRTETFLKREIRAMRDLPVDLELYSLWGGEPEFEGLVVHRFPKWRLATLIWWLPYWLCRRPLTLIRGLVRYANRPVPYWRNLGENFIGFAFAFCHAYRLSREPDRPELVHAVWATMPGSAALGIHLLTGIPFTVGAHAYDLFKKGGDWGLASKLQSASLIVTSTRAARATLLAKGAGREKLVVVRRGLDRLPAIRPPRADRSPLRILSVARLVEKKGLFDQLEIYAELARRGIRFEARIAGKGPLAKALEARSHALGLSPMVSFLGSLPFDHVLKQYAWADVFLFTGKVAADGDRDGLPNVIPEAMSLGVPVVSTDVGGTAEAIRDRFSGILLRADAPGDWVDALLRLRDDDSHYRALTREARAWVETNFDAGVNTEKLLRNLRIAATSVARESAREARSPVPSARHRFEPSRTN